MLLLYVDAPAGVTPYFVFFLFFSLAFAELVAVNRRRRNHPLRSLFDLEAQATLKLKMLRTHESSRVCVSIPSGTSLTHVGVVLAYQPGPHRKISCMYSDRKVLIFARYIAFFQPGSHRKNIYTVAEFLQPFAYLAFFVFGR